MDRSVRNLGHEKQSKIKFVLKRPEYWEGKDGDMRMYNDRLYIKNSDIWYSFIADSDNETDPNIFSKEDDGYLKLANGFILQWGQETVSDPTETVIFPIPFPNACLNVTSTAYKSGDDEGLGYAVAISTLPTKTQVVFSTRDDPLVGYWDTIFWQAIGY